MIDSLQVKEKFLDAKDPSMWPRPLRRILLSFSPTKLSPCRCSSSFAPAVRPQLIMPSAHKFTNDWIFIDKLTLKATCGPNVFKRRKPQPVTVSVELGTSIARAAAEDDVGMSVDYSQLTKQLMRLDGGSFEHVGQFMETIRTVALEKDGVANALLTVELDKGSLRAEKVVWTLAISGGEERREEWKLGVYGIEEAIIIGIKENLHERMTKQLVTFNMEWELGDLNATKICEIHVQSVVVSILEVTALPATANFVGGG
jgi:FolB domain-containing protein